MPDILIQALKTEGLWVLVLIYIVAGMVRGFSGFGTAMIVMPLGAMIVSPLWALTIMIVADIVAPLFMMRRAVQDGEPRTVGLLLIGAVLGLPFGLWLLTTLPSEQFRMIAGITILICLALLMSGWRITRALRPLESSGVGFSSGLLGGFLGLAGPPVILTQMASTRGAKIVRANLLMFLFSIDLVIILMLAVQGKLLLAPVVIGLLIAAPFSVAALIGQAIFNPMQERLYRLIAYAIVAASALLALPIWG